jgi:hypothetical protein
LSELASPVHSPLGVDGKKPSFSATERRLHPGERLILLTDGISGRRMEGGGTFGVEGMKAAVERAVYPTAACTAMAIQQAVTDCCPEPLEGDATVVVMAVV